MKTMTLIVMMIAVCSCCPNADNSDSGNPDTRRRGRDQVSKILKEHYHGFDYEFQIRGPLIVAQLEEELIESYEESSRLRKKVYGLTETFDESATGKDFNRLKGKYGAGDEIYFFTSDLHSWGDLNGKEGYVLVRRNELIDLIVTAVS